MAVIFTSTSLSSVYLGSLIFFFLMKRQITILVTNFCLHQGIFPKEDFQGSQTVDVYYQMTLQSQTVSN